MPLEFKIYLGSAEKVESALDLPLARWSCILILRTAASGKTVKFHRFKFQKIKHPAINMRCLRLI